MNKMSLAPCALAVGRAGRSRGRAAADHLPGQGPVGPAAADGRGRMPRLGQEPDRRRPRGDGGRAGTAAAQQYRRRRRTRARRGAGRASAARPSARSPATPARARPPARSSAPCAAAARRARSRARNSRAWTTSARSSSTPTTGRPAPAWKRAATPSAEVRGWTHRESFALPSEAMRLPLSPRAAVHLNKYDQSPICACRSLA